MISAVASRHLSRGASAWKQRGAVATRRWASQRSGPAHSRPGGAPVEEGEVVQVDSQTHMANIALASALLGFCGFVFTYSLNAVGRSDVDADGNDALAQLKEEAQEAKTAREEQQARRMSQDEIDALESGMRGADGVAVAAPADVAEFEKEAGRKIFGDDESAEAPKKKPWWRFGF